MRQVNTSGYLIPQVSWPLQGSSVHGALNLSVGLSWVQLPNLCTRSLRSVIWLSVFSVTRRKPCHILDDGNLTQTITVTGLNVPIQQSAITGYLTNAAKDFDEVLPVSQDKNWIVVSVPGYSLLSLRVSARNN